MAALKVAAGLMTAIAFSAASPLSADGPIDLGCPTADDLAGGAGALDAGDGGGPGACPSNDGTNPRSCYKSFDDHPLETLLLGTPDDPLDPPSVCGEVVATAADAQRILRTNRIDGEPCVWLKSDALVTELNLRRSRLFGDGKLSENTLSCFGIDPFRVVLRCGAIFVPDPDAGDPDAALVVTEATPLSEFLAAAQTLCELASCPGGGDPCGLTIARLANILRDVWRSNPESGDCALCPDDTTPPTIRCPEGVLTFECQCPEGAAIVYDVHAEDDCDPNPKVICFPPPGTILPLGRRTVRCQVIDLQGNKECCSFEVEVVDTTPPALSVPAERIVVDCAGGDDAVVNYPAPVATDICDRDVEIICDPPSGSVFPVGATTVTCVASDDSGNSSEATFVVEVVADAEPLLYCAGDVTAEATEPGGATVEFPLPMLSLSCETPATVECDPPSGSLFPLGETTVRCTATTDAGDMYQCEFVVNIVDTTPPAVVCPSDITVECTSENGTPVFFRSVASDRCDPDVDVVCDPPSGSAFPLGETIVRCVATDEAGNSAECEFSVVVRDTTPPRITCPQGPIEVSCSADGPVGGGVEVEFPSPMATDACGDGGVTIVCEPPSGSAFQPGTTTVTCTATDSSGNSSECSFEVVVVDEAPPAIVCLEDVLVDCDSVDGATVDYPAPVVVGECDGDVTIACDPPSGSFFPMGTTLVTCTATDSSGNEMSCEFSVTVDDLSPPQIVAPADLIVECAGPGGTPVDFSVTAVDACDPSPAVECDPPRGSVFLPGVTVVTCRATDQFGNESESEFSVSVVDTLPPAIHCPESFTYECESAEGSVVMFEVSAVDQCDTSVTATCDPPSGSNFDVGVTTVVCTATDAAGNSAECSFDVTVVDRTPPMIVCPPEAIVVECDDGGKVQYPLPVVFDACDADPVLVCDPPSGAVIPLGVNSVTCTATDASGNASECTFDIEVVDVEVPELLCVGDITTEATSPEGAVVEYTTPVTNDNCDPAPNLSCLPPSGSMFPIGTTVVTCTADDQGGNVIECSFNVIVTDSGPPMIECPSDIEAHCTSADGAVVSFDVTASDSGDPNPVVECVPPSGSLFPLGVTVVECTATDNLGNESMCSFSVTVFDNTPPTIECPEGFERSCTEDGGSVVEFPLPAAADDCDPRPVVECDPPSGSVLPPGSHVVTCTATDASGNSASCEFTITVVDEVAPELICPPTMMVQCDREGGALVEYDLPVSNDACDGQPPVECVPPSGTIFPLGETEVVCTSTDSSGNSTQCSFVVNVVDTTPPALTCPEPIVTECTSGEGAVVDFDVAAEDACDPDVAVVCTPASGSLFPVGQTTVTCVATDAEGNEAECSFTVTVIDRTAPEILCDDLVDLFLECDSVGEEAQKPPGWPPTNERGPIPCTTIVTFNAPTATDLCAGDDEVFIDCNPPSGSRLTLGEHTITCRARDAAGNESTCTFQVTIERGERAFVRGDANSDSLLDIADPIWTVLFLFVDGRPPKCMDAADANDDGEVDISDVMWTLGYSFMAGSAPPAPFYPFCGFDPTADELECEFFPPCE